MGGSVRGGGGCCHAAFNFRFLTALFIIHLFVFIYLIFIYREEKRREK